ncbi:hypothetical protein [Pseudomonas yamanorum]
MKKIIAPILLCAACAVSSLSATANSGISIKPYPMPAVTTTTTKFQQSCTKNVGNAYYAGGVFYQPLFRGTAYGVVTRSSTGHKTVKVTGYNIYKHYIKQNAGNKANLNLSIDSGSQHKSADNLKQHTNWGTIDSIDLSRTAVNGRTANFQFIFDKSGNDPSCTATLAL